MWIGAFGRILNNKLKRQDFLVPTKQFRVKFLFGLSNVPDISTDINTEAVRQIEKIERFVLEKILKTLT